MQKHERELDALRAVYSEATVRSAVHHDRPDFLLTRQSPPLRFGVEITDIYPTESDARLQNRPGYIQQLFEGGPYIHRDDAKNIPVATVEVSAEDGNVKATGLPAIIQEVQDGPEHYEQIAEAIRIKSRKANAYTPWLNHLNLIIVDHFPNTEDRSEPYFTGTLLGHGVRAALTASPFHEVFLVDRDKYGARAYRPLMLILLLEQFKLFVHALHSFPEHIPTTLDEVASLFVHAMRDTEMDLVYYSEAPGHPVATYRGAAVHISEGAINVLDLHDVPRLQGMAPPSLPVDPDMWQRILLYYRTFASDNGMEFGFTVPEANTSRPTD